MPKMVSAAACGLVVMGLGCLDVERLIRANPLSPAHRQQPRNCRSVHCANNTGLSGEPFAYPEEMLSYALRVEFPVGGSVPLHTHPAPLITYVAQGQIRHTRGDEVNTFGPGEAFVEGNQEGPHAVENIGDGPAVLFVAVASKQGLRTSNFVSSEP